MSLVIRSASPGGIRSTRATSLTAARAFIVPKVTIWPDARPAVALPHVLDHLAPALEAEVHVDVGHRHPLGVEEALEQQVEPERADVGDAERVRHDASPRPSRGPGPTGMPRSRAARDEVLHDEEVAGVARRVDDAELVASRCSTSGGQRGAVAPHGARAGEMLEQRLVARVLGGAGEARAGSTASRSRTRRGRPRAAVLASVSGWSGKSARISFSDLTYDSWPVKRNRLGSSRSLPVPMASSTSCASASSRRR